MKLKTANLLCSMKELETLPEGKLLINTINAFSYNNAQKDALFSEALENGDVLVPDGAGIVKACRWINAKCQPKERIAGWDLFIFEMERLSQRGRGRVMFLGSSETVLSLIRERAARDYPCLEVVTYSPPYKPVFTDKENRDMVRAINEASPDLLWIGMTAPKQEKWTYTHWSQLDIHCHVGAIGAVFDFYAGTTRRAPLWWQRHSLEWLYRLLKEPRRMWRRYIIGNVEFIYRVMKERKG